jgi:nucleotide-binding universal stress UspA family protein
MREALLARIRAAVDRFHRLERRELRHLRRHVEVTGTIVHVSILLFVPFLVGVLVYVTTRVEALSFLLFPPLAAGTYMLFANPESEQASPIRFVGGLTAGAVCAWIAIEIALRFVYPGLPPSALAVDAPGAAFAVFLTGVITWVLDIEEPAAYAMALLGLLVEPGNQAAFVLSVLVGSTIVAVAFYTWRELFYERRATYLYASTRGDDHVLVPMLGETAEATATLGARLAAAHDAGTVVLLDVVDDAEIAAAERRRLATADSAIDLAATDGGEAAATAEAAAPPDVPDAVEDAATRLEEQAARIRTRVGVPCEVMVAVEGASRSRTVLDAAADANCDLVTVPYETKHGSLSPFVRELFRGDLDVLVHRSRDGRTAWREVMVPVRGPSDVAHSMIDFGLRLAGKTGRVSVSTCIRSADQRRRADAMLADLVETFEGNVETRVATASIEQFLSRNASEYDLVCIGASRDRSAASRLISPPTFERIRDLDTDVAIVDRS